jgi:hypothetical protein
LQGPGIGSRLGSHQPHSQYTKYVIISQAIW